MASNCAALDWVSASFSLGLSPLISCSFLSLQITKFLFFPEQPRDVLDLRGLICASRKEQRGLEENSNVYLQLQFHSILCSFNADEMALESESEMYPYVNLTHTIILSQTGCKSQQWELLQRNAFFLYIIMHFKR